MIGACGFRLQAEARFRHRRRYALCSVVGMTHPYPRHRSGLPYKGKHFYFLTFCTDQRRQLFNDADVVDQVRTQFLSAGSKYHFEITAYCFMPDHVHLAIHGTAGHSDCKAFIKAAKQYSGCAFRQRHEFRCGNVTASSASPVTTWNAR